MSPVSRQPPARFPQHDGGERRNTVGDSGMLARSMCLQTHDIPRPGSHRTGIEWMSDRRAGCQQQCRKFRASHPDSPAVSHRRSSGMAEGLRHTPGPCRASSVHRQRLIARTPICKRGILRAPCRANELTDSVQTSPSFFLSFSRRRRAAIVHTHPPVKSATCHAKRGG